MAGPFKMANLARSKESLSPKSVGEIKPSPYSYEHRITLDGDTMDKLGMDIPKPGDKFHVLGHAEVTNVSQNSDQEGGKTARAELQFKRMGLKPATGSTNGLFNAVNDGVQQANDSSD